MSKTRNPIAVGVRLHAIRIPNRIAPRDCIQPHAEPLLTPMRHFITTTTMANARIMCLLNVLTSLQCVLREYSQFFTFVVEEQTRVNHRMLFLSEPQRETRRATRRKFWVRPGRTSRWWDNVLNGMVVVNEWMENFRMSRASLFALSEELRPYIERQTTNMRARLLER